MPVVELLIFTETDSEYDENTIKHAEEGHSGQPEHRNGDDDDHMISFDNSTDPVDVDSPTPRLINNYKLQINRKTLDDNNTTTLMDRAPLSRQILSV